VFERLGIDLVLDVGANAGQYAAEIRRHGYRGRIISFEPGSDAFAALCAASADDELWCARKLALGFSPGTASLNIAANEGKSSSFLAQRGYTFGTTASMRYVASEDVAVVTLDALAGEILADGERAFLKIDVQGFELGVLRGAEATLPRILAVETELALLPVYAEHSDWREICDWMSERGFVLYALDPGYSDWESGRLVEMDALFVRGERAELA
jgi:FkbM family methyltransferase